VNGKLKHAVDKPYVLHPQGTAGILDQAIAAGNIRYIFRLIMVNREPVMPTFLILTFGPVGVPSGSTF
jgi:hypothetical protein